MVAVTQRQSAATASNAIPGVRCKCEPCCRYCAYHARVEVSSFRRQVLHAAPAEPGGVEWREDPLSLDKQNKKVKSWFRLKALIGTRLSMME